MQKYFKIVVSYLSIISKTFQFVALSHSYLFHQDNLFIFAADNTKLTTFMKTIILSCMLTLAAMVNMNADAQTFRLFTSDKLSSNLITCICQDKTGYIWIGTEYGLNKFDGYRFTTYLHDDDDSTTIHDNFITNIYIDRSGRLIIGSSQGVSIYDYKRDCFHIARNAGNQPHISSFSQLPDGLLLACTAGFGAFSINLSSMMMKQYGQYLSNSAENFINEIYVDKKRYLWTIGSTPTVARYNGLYIKPRMAQIYPSYLGVPQKFIINAHGEMYILCQHGLMKYNRQNDCMEKINLIAYPFDLKNISMRTAIIARNGDLFIGTTDNGIFCVKKGTTNLTAVGNSIKGFNLGASNIRAICEDREGNLWIGCNKKGLLFIPKKKAKFTTWSFAEQNYNIGGSISSICNGDHGNIWCTIQNNGVYGFDRNGKIFKHPTSPSHTNIIYKDKSGNYWIGAGSGLFRYNPTTGSAKLALKIDGETINTMEDDGHGTLFVSDFGKGLKVFNTKTNRCQSYSMYMNSARGRLNNDWIMTLKYDSRGILWIGNTAGFIQFSPPTGVFTPRQGNGYLVLSTCNAFYELPDHKMLIGTSAGLYLFNTVSDTAVPFGHAKLLRNKSIASIEKDKNGDLWFSTSMGIWQYKTAQRQLSGYINGNGLATHEYAINAVLHADDDRIFYGTSDGITSFYPQSVKSFSIIRREPILTNLIIGGKTINCSSTSNGSCITEKEVDQSNHFCISYIDNTFTMEFSMMEYGYAGNIIYQYRLNGQGDWTSTEEGSNAIMFNHLQPGTYTLEVRANINGSYSPVKTFYITITPPWYSSTFAYIIYVFILMSLAYYVFYIYNRHRREEMYEEKMKFLINATHDIRSPLTLITGPLHKLMKKEFDSETNNELNVIDRNAQRILRLVNQILDARKLDKKQMALHCQKTNLPAYIEEIKKNFEFHAKESNICFTFENDNTVTDAWIDRINFDKVISNLLSNAFKYTFDGGKIAIILSSGHDAKASAFLKDYIEIRVVDNGIGIKEKVMDRVFERFYQSSNASSANVQGTGIGLNVCKMIVDLHHGSIKAENGPDGHGTCMTIRIPQGYEHLSEEERLQDEDTLTVAGKKKWNNARYKIMIVDDDADICRYISGELGGYFKFKACGNGKEALAELLKNSYDLVISDVMMPEMDGFTLTKNIKSNSLISHLPIILLTSKSDVDNRLTGFEKGADAYIEKPFDMEELHVVINNLIKNRLRLKGKFSGAQQQEGKIENIHEEIVGNDEHLMQRIIKSVNSNLGDADFNVDTLASDVGLSRAQLHRKMKDMTGISSGEFIRNVRLDQAAKLLRENKVNITQVAYSVGFNNQTHFSTVFRKHFGISPSEYVEEHKKEE